MNLELLFKSLSGGTIVTCPHCGHKFVRPEKTSLREVLSTVKSVLEKMESDKHIQKRFPDITRQKRDLN